MKCSSCSADIPAEAKICEYCNSAVLRHKESDRGATFSRIKASSQFAERNSPARLARLPKVGGFQKAIGLGFFIVFTGASAFMVFAAFAMAGIFGGFGMHQFGDRGAAFSMAPLLFAIVPSGFVIFGIFMFRHLKKKMDKFESDPTDAIPVIIIDKRTEVWGGSGDSSANTNYHVTCETADSKRQEYQVWDGKLYGRMAVGDAGVLFARSTYGLDFDRILVGS